MATPLYLIMPPQPGLLAGFATGLHAIRRHLALHLPHWPIHILDWSAEDESVLPALLQDLGNGNSDEMLLGITTTTATYQSALSVARNAKRWLGARAFTLLGGPHASSDAEVILTKNEDIIDYVIRGEGERAVEQFLRSWPAVSDVPGLVLREGSKVRLNTLPAPLSAAELDLLTLDESWFAQSGHPGKFDGFTYVSARGCPLSCAFCSVSNQAIRAKSPDVVETEIKRIVGHGYQKIAFEDNFFAHSPRRTRAICEVLTRAAASLPTFKWDCQTRVEAIARAGTARLLAQAGCTAVYLGVEALAYPALTFLKKALRPKQYVELALEVALPALLDEPMDINVNIQFGLPNEAGIYLEETAERLRSMGRRADARRRQVTIFPQLFVIYPGTDHFTSFLADGILWPTIFEDFTAWEASESDLIYWMGRYFAHGVGGLPLGILDRAALKRHQFRVDPRPLLAVERRLSTLSSCDGLAVFRYSEHLAPAAQRKTKTSRTDLRNETVVIPFERLGSPAHASRLF